MRRSTSCMRGKVFGVLWFIRMINLKARKIYAQNLRAYFTGRITNREYEDRIPSDVDSAIDYIEHNFVWPEYDDLKTHYRNLKDLTPAGKETLKRILLFLYSDLPFEWPPAVGDRSKFSNWLTLGRAGRRYEKMKQAFDSYGSEETFPFRNKAELCRELSLPRDGLSLRPKT